MLALACAAAALLLAADLAPPALRWPLAVAGGVWAPGYALLAAAYPRGRLAGLERHALALGLGLVLLPLAGLAASATLGFTLRGVAWVLLAVTLAAALVARLRGGGAERALHGRAPSTAVTLGIAGATLAACAALVLASPSHEPVPASLAVETPEGKAAGPVRLADGRVSLVAVARAGDAPLRADLVATLDGREVARESIDLPAGGEARVPLALDAPGELVVRLGDDRLAHVWVRAEGAP